MVSMVTHYAILKNGDASTKNTHILAGTHLRTLNLVSNSFKDIAVILLVGYANYLIKC